MADLLEQGAHAGAILSGIGVIFVGLALIWQRRSVRHQSLLHLHQYLAQDAFSASRHRVRTELYQKPYGNWNDRDKDDANSVCASYDQAGLLISNGTIDKKTTNSLLESSWGESVCDQYEALTPFLSDYQTPNKTGYEFFFHFTGLYKKARNAWREPIKGDPLKIVSGGQTGADRAALDTAIALGLPYGGWCPKGGRAEDMPRSPGLLLHYDCLRETTTIEPKERTELNVRDSNATVIIVNSRGLENSPGTKHTIEAAKKYERPFKVIHADTEDAVEQISVWINGQPNLKVLNVAGPRESEAPGLYSITRALLQQVLKTPEASKM